MRGWSASAHLPRSSVLVCVSDSVQAETDDESESSEPAGGERGVELIKHPLTSRAG